jgi:hypothetical protein
MTMNV